MTGKKQRKQEKSSLLNQGKAEKIDVLGTHVIKRGKRRKQV